jgi:hypothetical protein
MSIGGWIGLSIVMAAIMTLALMAANVPPFNWDIW